MDKKEEFIYELNRHPVLNKIRWNPNNNAFVGHFRLRHDLPLFIFITYKVYDGMMFCQFARESIYDSVDKYDLSGLSSDIEDSEIFSELGFPHVIIEETQFGSTPVKTLLLQIETEYADSYVSPQNAIKAMYFIVKLVAGELLPKLINKYGNQIVIMTADSDITIENSLINIW